MGESKKSHLEKISISNELWPTSQACQPSIWYRSLESRKTMSNYNPYSAFISGLNTITPEDPQEDLDTSLQFWSSAQFTFDVPTGIGLLNDDFDVSLSKLESADTTEINQPSPLVQPEISSFTNSTTQAIYHPLLSYHNPSANTTTRLQPVVPIAPAVTSTSNNYSPIFPAPLTSSRVTANKTNNHFVQKEEGPSPIITTSAVATTPAITANSKIISSTSSRKNSNVKSVQSSSIDTNSLNDTNTENTESQTTDPELAAKIAADEDKRRRNTAASARFRVKKKQREQALERTAKEMSEKAQTLEIRVKELEKEVRWLKNLIVEKDPRLLELEPPGKKRKTSIKSESSSEESAEKEEREHKEKSDNNQLKKLKMNDCTQQRVDLTTESESDLHAAIICTQQGVDPTAI